MHRPNFFAGPYLERRSELRELADWRAAALADASTLYVVSRGTTQLLQKDNVQPSIAFLKGDHPLVRAADEHRLVLLGWFRDARCVLLNLEPEESPALPPEAAFEELRPLVSSLRDDDAALLAYARALSIWRLRTRYCGACGAPTLPRSAGHELYCSRESCAQQFFPRIDPAIIVLVSEGERALLGRQASWPAGRYSTVAGFVEPGESLEDAVIREVLEETGVAVRDVHYRSSQPWPFPSSLMIGFHAVAHPYSVIRVGEELEDARWFTREELASGQAMPTPHSISHRLISEWLARL